MRKAIFLDKDGTLIDNFPFNVNPDLIRLKDKSLDGLKTFQDFGYLLIIVTNQTGVAHGLFPEKSIMNVREKMERLYDQEGIRLDDFYYCPHDVNGSIERYATHCVCHKPLPGLLLKAAHQYQIDLFHSWMIGDTLNDVEAGNRAGCKSILIDNGGETIWKPGRYRKPFTIADNLDDAADQIIQNIFLNNIYE